MSTEIQIASNIKVIRYYGGKRRGVCFDFFIETSGETEKATFTALELTQIVRDKEYHW